MSCVVKKCDGINSAEIRTFQFPRTEEEKKKWLDNLKIAKVTQWSRVCSRHFTPDCFQIKKLKKGAMPTIDLGHNDAVIHQSCFVETVNWYRKCSIQGCDTTKPPCQTMYGFPKSKKTRESWLEVCTLKKEAKGLANLFICRKHFKDEDMGQRTYLPTAIPSLQIKGEVENEVSSSFNENIKVSKEMRQQYENFMEEVDIDEDLLLDPLTVLDVQCEEMYDLIDDQPCTSKAARMSQRRQEKYQERDRQFYEKREKMRQGQNDQYWYDFISQQQHEELEQKKLWHQQELSVDDNSQPIQIVFALEADGKEEKKERLNCKKYKEIAYSFKKRSKCQNCKNEKFFRKQNLLLQEKLKAQEELHRCTLQALQEEINILKEKCKGIQNDCINTRRKASEDTKILRDVINNGFRKVYTKEPGKCLNRGNALKRNLLPCQALKELSF